MKIAILADIHANLNAFTAVLKDVEQRGGVDNYWCLGDVVNYGPDPSKCVELLRRLKHVAIAGNHDLAAAGKIPLNLFNPDAARAMEWTIKQLNQEDIGFLAGLGEMQIRDDFTMVHGSPRDPIWEYLLSVTQAEENFGYFNTSYCLVGHSHEPQLFRVEEDGRIFFMKFNEGLGQVAGRYRLIINPGSVGQPRDGDPRASYCIFDTESRIIRLFRVSYDIGATQLKMVRANLPMRLVVRLEKGV
jgi:diadenosine tetraphosphatase ApaH/serine/threonine PP2A family protein phosphatase